MGGVLPAHSAAGCPVVFKSRPSKFVCILISPCWVSSIDSEGKHVQEFFLSTMLSATWLYQSSGLNCAELGLLPTSGAPQLFLQLDYRPRVQTHCWDLRGHHCCESMVKVLCSGNVFCFFYFVSLETQHELMVTQVGVALSSWAECMARTPESGL